MSLALLGCGEAERFSTSPATGHAVLTDTDPRPRVVEVEIVAAPAVTEFLPGLLADVWAYRDGANPSAAGSVPGPLLKAKLGDRVIVHFRNDLPASTTVHWHGVRVPNASDGTLASQKSVGPGESFDYEFTANDAGLFWYHPHLDGEVQLERGLYAPMLVYGGAEPDVTTDRVLVLDDVKLESNGQLSETTDNLDLMLGRQGNVQLVNGALRPVLQSRARARERWRFVNAANGRYFNLELPGRTFLVIGWDGGLLEEPYSTKRLLITPGERYDVLVELAGSPGDELALRNAYYDRGHSIPDRGPVDLLRVKLGPRGLDAAVLPRTWGTVQSVPVTSNTEVLDFVLEENDDVASAPKFSINGEMFPQVTAIEATDGELAIWQIQNRTEMDHPFHVHGMSFQLLEGKSFEPTRRGFKDTVNVRRGETLRFAMRYEGLGHWMYHCHILEHAERGMMGELMVSAPDASVTARHQISSAN